MRIDAENYNLANISTAKEPRYVVEVAFDDAFTDLHYFTSHADAAVPVDATVIHGCVKHISGTSQHVKPEKALATIGTLDYTLVNVDDSIGTLQYDKLQAGFGLKGKRVRVYTGFKGLLWSEYSRVTTQIIETVGSVDNDYKFQCSDVQREERKDIFDLAETNLSQSLLLGETTVNVYSTAAFTAIAHGSSYTDAPDESVIYFKIDDEVIRAPLSGVTATEFTNCTRGALNTATSEHIIDASTPAERRTEVTEHVYLEMPAPKLMYALLTGNLLGQTGETLPTSWHLGIDLTYVRDTDFTGIGEDLYDTADDSAGLVLRFEGLKKQDGKRFIERELLLLMGTFSPVYTDGALGLKRMVSVLSKASYVMELNEDNVVGYSDLLADMKSIHNEIEIKWNWIDTKGRFTRTNTLIDQPSIDVHGETNPLKFSFRGLHGSIHSVEKLGERFNAFRDRYTGPPLRLSLTCLPSTNRLEVGDTVRVNLPQLDDYNSGTKLNRTFEVQNVSIDWITGAVHLTLFGSSQPASAINYSIVSSCVLPRAMYVSEGINIATHIGSNYDYTNHYENIGGVGHLKLGTPTLTHDWATVIAASSPSAWYRFNEDPVTGTCFDETVNNHDGTYSGSLVAVDGLVEGDVSGAINSYVANPAYSSSKEGSGYVQMPSSLDAVVKTSSFTIEAIIQRGHEDKLILLDRCLCRRSSYEYGFHVQVASHEIVCVFNRGQYNVGYTFTAPYTFRAGKTYHVAVTRDISTGFIEAFVNGVSIGSRTRPAGSVVYFASYDRGFSTMAQRYNTFTERNVGTVSELVLYNSVLPSATILDHANHSGVNDYLSAHPMLIGGDDLRNGNGVEGGGNSIYYHDGDLVIDADVICRIKDNVQLRVRGHLQINGKVDGVGLGLPGGAWLEYSRDYCRLVESLGCVNYRRDEYSPGVEGFIGPTKSGGGYYSPRAQCYMYSLDGRQTDGQHSVAPNLTFEYDHILENIIGVPNDIRGTSGASGRQTGLQTSSYWWNIDGGAGGDGGAGLAILSRGCNFGASGQIDVSGGPGNKGGYIGNGSGQNVFIASQEAHHGGSGAGGAPGAVYFMIDGTSSPTPLLDYVKACFGRTPICGRQQNSPSQYFCDGRISGIYPLYSYYRGVDGCADADLSGYEGAARISFVVGCERPEPDPVVPPADVTNFTANPLGDAVVLNWDAVTASDLSGYEIRYTTFGSGETWDEAAIAITINGTNTNVTLTTILEGSYTFMIKAVNSSGVYSVNEATDDATVTSEYVNKITTDNEYPLWNGTLTNMVKLFDHVLVPDSLQTMDNYTTWSQFETANPEPYTDAYYEIATPIDIGFDALVRVWSQITSRLMPGEVAKPQDPVSLQIDYRLAAGSYAGFIAWVIGEVKARYVKMRIHVTTGNGIPAITGMTNYVDARERTEAGVAVVGATGTTITFTDQFFAAPTVTVDPQGATPLTVTRSSITATSFVANVYDSGGVQVGGTIDWTATGV